MTWWAGSMAAARGGLDRRGMVGSMAAAGPLPLSILRVLTRRGASSTVSASIAMLLLGGCTTMGISGPLEGRTEAVDGDGYRYARHSFSVDAAGLDLDFNGLGGGRCRRYVDCYERWIGVCYASFDGTLVTDVACDGSIDRTEAGWPDEDPSFFELERRYVELRREARVESAYLVWLLGFAPRRQAPHHVHAAHGLGLGGALLVEDEGEDEGEPVQRERHAGAMIEYREQALRITRPSTEHAAHEPNEPLEFEYDPSLGDLGCKTRIGMAFHHGCDADRIRDVDPEQVRKAWEILHVQEAMAQWIMLRSDGEVGPWPR